MATRATLLLGRGGGWAARLAPAGRGGCSAWAQASGRAPVATAAAAAVTTQGPRVLGGGDSRRHHAQEWLGASVLTAASSLVTAVHLQRRRMVSKAATATGGAVTSSGIKLKGKVAIVTGASSGIGLAVAKALASEGMTLVLVARNLPKLENLAKNIADSSCYACNVKDRQSVHAVVEETVKKHGRVDLVANCAGVMYFTLMRNLCYDDWEETIDTNCKGIVNVCGAALPHMIKQRTGHVVNITSDAARQVFPALAVYNASKAFAHVFSRSLRAECVGTGVRVTDVQPGDTATNLIMNNRDAEAAGKVGVKIGDVVGAGFDRPSVLDPEDVAAAVLFAVTAPDHVGMHEILIEPRDQMYGDPTAMGVAPEGSYGKSALGPDKS